MLLVGECAMGCVCECFLVALKRHILLWFRKQGHIAFGEPGMEGWGGIGIL